VINRVPLRGTARLIFINFETPFEHGPSYGLDNDAIPPLKALICALFAAYLDHPHSKMSFRVPCLS
jgi:hypothetical protein